MTTTRHPVKPCHVATFREVVRGVVRAIKSGELARFAKDVESGADPVEAMHGHVCGSKCWHQQLRKVAR